MNSQKLIGWDIYEIRSKISEVHGVMLRGRIRKLGLENNLNILSENASDEEKCVRFAVQTGESAAIVTNYLASIIPDVEIKKVAIDVKNPILSKLKVNREDRYSL